MWGPEQPRRVSATGDGVSESPFSRSEYKRMVWYEGIKDEEIILFQIQLHYFILLYFV